MASVTDESYELFHVRPQIRKLFLEQWEFFECERTHVLVRVALTHSEGANKLLAFARESFPCLS